MMSAPTRSLRLRALLSEWFVYVLLVTVLLAAVGGGWAYTVHTGTEVETSQVTVESWSETTAFNHSAVVTNDSLPFTKGERIANRPVYYTSVVETIDVTYRYEHTAGSEFQVTTDASLVYQGIEGDAQLWQYTEPLASSQTTVTSNETHVVNATLDVTQIEQTLAEIQAQLGETGTTQLRVVATSRVEGEYNGETIAQTHESTIPLVITPETLRVQSVETVDASYDETETVERPVEPPLSTQLGSIGVTVSGVLLTAGLVVARRRHLFRLTPDEREMLELHQQEQEFAEWITTGTFPSEQDFESVITVDDLEGLVDIAIDTNNRVIKDEQLGVSAVLADRYVYIYILPDSPARDWLLNYADMSFDEFDQF
jgi:hypothetical protein